MKLLSRQTREMAYHTALVRSKQIGIGSRHSNKNLRELLEKYGSFEEIFKAKNGLYYKDNLYQIKEFDRLIKKLKDLEEGMGVLRISDSSFPESLKKFRDSSPVIYYRGNKELLNKKAIAVVGTREPERIDLIEGESVLERILKKDYVIISGLARGCDTLAHSYALENKGKTIAVLGTPINKNYPRENEKLQEKIAKDHLLISEYPVGIRTYPSHFANRNITTVSLASDGVIVIRAGDKSGTMHAIRECVRQDKQLYVLENNLHQNYEWIQKFKFIVPNKK